VALVRHPDTSLYPMVSQQRRMVQAAADLLPVASGTPMCRSGIRSPAGSV